MREKSCGTVDPAFFMASGKARSRWHNIAGRSLWAGTFGTETMNNIEDQLGQLITSLTYNEDHDPNGSTGIADIVSTLRTRRPASEPRRKVGRLCRDTEDTLNGY